MSVGVVIGRCRLRAPAPRPRAHLEMVVDTGLLREAEVAGATDLADHVTASLYELLRSRSAA